MERERTPPNVVDVLKPAEALSAKRPGDEGRIYADNPTKKGRERFNPNNADSFTPACTRHHVLIPMQGFLTTCVQLVK